MWGTSSNDLYIVGNSGLIAHYDGRRWRRIESATKLPIQDIWGAWNEREGKWEILAVASDKYHNQGKRLLKVNSNGVMVVPDEGLPWSLSGVWFAAPYATYVVGDGIYLRKYPTDHWLSLHPGLTPFYTDAIRGSVPNNVFVCGAFGEVLHFNGLSWRSFRNQTALNYGA